MFSYLIRDWIIWFSGTWQCNLFIFRFCLWLNLFLLLYLYFCHFFFVEEFDFITRCRLMLCLKFGNNVNLLSTWYLTASKWIRLIACRMNALVLSDLFWQIQWKISKKILYEKFFYVQIVNIFLYERNAHIQIDNIFFISVHLFQFKVIITVDKIQMWIIPLTVIALISKIHEKWKCHSYHTLA